MRELIMDMTPEEYQNYVEQKAKKSPLIKDMLLAFLIGGVICAVGQAVMNGWSTAGLSKEDAGTATSCTLVLISALLTGLNLYNKLARFGGAGTLVPITGFANAVVSPAIDFKSEGFVTGMAAKMFQIAGPVIVFGTLAGVIYGVVLMLLS
jgi:stage V sporulation protein AC